MAVSCGKVIASRAARATLRLMHTPFAARFLWSSARIVLGLAGIALTAAADWPQFRGLTGVGLSSEKNLPLKWGGKEKENVLWQTPLIGQGHASPIVSGDAVFVCTVSWPTNSSQREKVMPDHHVTRYRVADGKQMWTTQVPPVKGPLHDAARALQFVRSKSAEWNIDKQRIGASGGSAGACSSLWLAFHPDMADAKSSDPIARESTRLWCAAVIGAQTTLDPQQMKEWTPNSNYGGHAFGFAGDPEKKLSQFAEFLAKRDTILPWIAEYSPYALVTSDDPPIYLSYGPPPALGQEQKDPTHTANFGVKLQEQCKKVGVACELVYQGAPDVKHATTQDYLIAKLKAKR